jgi:hypothetical protein
METICSSETSVESQRTTRRYIPEDRTLHNHRCKNLISYTVLWLGCELDDRGLNPGKIRNVLFTIVFRTALSLSNLVSNEVISSGVNRTWLETRYLLVPSAEVKNAFSYGPTSTPPCVFVVSCLIKHRDNFTFLYLHSTIRLHGVVLI